MMCSLLNGLVLSTSGFDVLTFVFISLVIHFFERFFIYIKYQQFRQHYLLAPLFPA
jgi:hypothetical protein